MQVLHNIGDLGGIGGLASALRRRLTTTSITGLQRIQTARNYCGLSEQL